MKLYYTQCLLAVLTFGVATTVLAENEKGDLIPLSDECNIFLKFPIGGTPEQLVATFGEPFKKRDISILTYTWRVDDNFLTLQYDRGSLTSIEIDKACDGVSDHKACDIYAEYKKDWPALNSVEATLGQPMEKGSITREEWIYKSKTEKAYVEFQNSSVENIECIPIEYRYKFESSSDTNNAETEAEETNKEVQEDFLKDTAPSRYNYDRYDDYDYDGY